MVVSTISHGSSMHVIGNESMEVRNEGEIDELFAWRSRLTEAWLVTFGTMVMINIVSSIADTAVDATVVALENTSKKECNTMIGARPF